MIPSPRQAVKASRSATLDAWVRTPNSPRSRRFTSSSAPRDRILAVRRWAVDFHAGKVSRPHDDLDLAVWSKDHDRVAALLMSDGWSHTAEEGEDGYTVYARGDVRLEVAFLQP
jgi:Aminoglycoside-2''-adenylyltransferase